MYFWFFWYWCVDSDDFDVIFVCKGFFEDICYVDELFGESGIFNEEIGNMIGWIGIWGEVNFVDWDGKVEFVEDWKDIICCVVYR